LASFFEILAQATQSTTGPTTKAAPMPPWAEFLSSPMPYIAVFLLILYVFMISGKKKQESTRKSMLDQLKKGDRIQTIGGILGTVIEARDDEVLVKVDESSNTKIRFTRSAIHRVIEADKEKSAKPST